MIYNISLEFVDDCVIQDLQLPAPSCMSASSLLCVSLHKKTGGFLLSVRAKPTGKRNRIANISGEALEVELAAKPHNGEANQELLDYMSDIFRIKKRDLSLVSGDKSRDKQVLVNPGLVTEEHIVSCLHTEFNS